MSRRDGRTPRQRVFGVFYRGDGRAREVSPSRSALSSPLSARDSVRFGRDVAPRRPHTMSVYRRPRNDEQLPRWFQHRTSDNWSAPSYVYSPVSCHAPHCTALRGVALTSGAITPGHLCQMPLCPRLALPLEAAAREPPPAVYLLVLSIKRKNATRVRRPAELALRICPVLPPPSHCLACVAAKQ